MSNRPAEIWCDTGLYWDYKDDWSEGSWTARRTMTGEKYVRADLATPIRCAECDCEKGGADCNWIATPAPAVKVKALVWQRNGDHHAGGYGYVIRKMGSQYTLTVRNSHGQNFDTIEAAKAAAQAHHDATILAALETATPLDDPRVKALVEAAREVKADCIARADKHGVVPIGRGAWDQLTAALEATASPSIATPLDDPRVKALVVALRFYAWENEARLPSEGPWGAASTDFGQVARAALEATASPSISALEENK